MMQHMHNHCHCDHDLKFCDRCDVVYCKKCNREWKQQSYTFTWGGTQTSPGIWSYAQTQANTKAQVQMQTNNAGHGHD